MLTDKDLTLLMTLIGRERREVQPITKEVRAQLDSITCELVTMRDAYRRSVAAITLAHTGRKAVR